MATKSPQTDICVSSGISSVPKPPAEPAGKADSAEELRRRKAGIACFL